MPAAKILLLLFVLVFLVPLGLSALRYRLYGLGDGWQGADRSSAGLLRRPSGSSLRTGQPGAGEDVVVMGAPQGAGSGAAVSLIRSVPAM